MNALKSFLWVSVIPNIVFSFDIRVELGGSYEYLSPHGTYGSWEGAFIRVFKSPYKGFTYFGEVDFFSRKIEGTAMLGVLGAYKDWREWLYTYSALSSGTNSTYLPEFRVDHEFNFKLGAERNIVPSLGFTYIKYYSKHRDTMIFPGITYYKKGFIIGYKHFFNKSDPGGLRSSSDMLSLEVGKEYESWTYLTVSYGSQAYLATYLAAPEEVRQDTLYITLGRRQWIKQDFGLFVEVNYLKLKGGYEKYGFSTGLFRDF